MIPDLRRALDFLYGMALALSVAAPDAPRTREISRIYQEACKSVTRGGGLPAEARIVLEEGCHAQAVH